MVLSSNSKEKGAWELGGILLHRAAIKQEWAQMRPTERAGHRKVLQQLVASQMETTERGPTLGADALPSLPGGLCTSAPFWVGRKGRKERILLMVVSRRGPSYSGT